MIKKARKTNEHFDNLHTARTPVVFAECPPAQSVYRPAPSRRSAATPMNTKDLTERDICTKRIIPAVVRAGWDLQEQIREGVSFTAGRIIVPEGEQHGPLCQSISTPGRSDLELMLKGHSSGACVGFSVPKSHSPIKHVCEQDVGY